MAMATYWWVASVGHPLLCSKMEILDALTSCFLKSVEILMSLSTRSLWWNMLCFCVIEYKWWNDSKGCAFWKPLMPISKWYNVAFMFSSLLKNQVGDIFYQWWILYAISIRLTMCLFSKKWLDVMAWKAVLSIVSINEERLCIFK